MGRTSSNTSSPVSPVGAGGIQRARQIAGAGNSPIQQAQTMAGQIPVAPYIPPQPTPSVLPPLPTAPVQYVQTGRAVNGSPAPYIPPIIHEPFVNPETPEVPPVIISRPNPEYVKNIPPPPPTPDPEAPKTESIITQEVNKIIEESNEIVEEVISKVNRFQPPVIPFQDIVRPPAAITPTDILLENQKNCQKEIEKIPTITIINEFNPTIDLSAEATGIATGSGVTFTTIITGGPPVPGCMDPDAMNYNPLASIDDESCVYEPPPGPPEPVTPDPPLPPLAIPDPSTYLDSHGSVVFEVPRALVEQTERTDTNGIIRLPSGVKVVASLQLVEDITRPAQADSDLILTEAEKEVAEKVAIRAEVGGELNNDTMLDIERDIIIIGDLESTKDKLIRNNNGVIILSSDKNPKLPASLRSQSFNYTQYKNTIDTSLTELLGKL